VLAIGFVDGLWMRQEQSMQGCAHEMGSNGFATPKLAEIARTDVPNITGNISSLLKMDDECRYK
jgi:hypothetical protein